MTTDRRPPRRARPWTTIALGVLLSALGAPSARPDAEPVEYQFRASRAALFTTSPEGGAAGAQVLCDYFAREYNSTANARATVRAEVAASFDAIERGVRDGSIEFAYVTSMEYLRLQERVEAQLVALTTPEGSERLSRAVVVVRADDPARSIADLKGRTFARSGRTSTVGYLYPQWLLVSAGLPKMDTFFGKVLDVRADKSAFYAVATGDADCASVDETLLATMKELSPGVAKRCKVIATSEPMPYGVVVASTQKRTSGMANAIQLVSRGLSSNSENVRAALRLIHIGGLSAAQPGDLDYVKRLWTDVTVAEARFLDPICGRECIPVAPGAPGAVLTGDVGGERVHFCSAECLEEFRAHERHSKAQGPDRIVVVGLLRPAGMNLKWQDVIAATRALFEMVAEQTEFRFAFEVYTSRSIGEERARAGVLSVLNVTAADYPRLHATLGAEPIVRPVITEAPEHLVLVAKSPNLDNGLAGLRGKRIAYSNASDLPTASYLRYLTRGLGAADPDDVFSQTLVCPSDASAIRALSLDQVDGALVSESALRVMTDLSPGVTRGFQRAAPSVDLANGPLCAMPSLDPATLRFIRDRSTGISDFPEGKQLLQMFGAVRMVPACDDDYANIRTILGNVEGK